MTRIYRGLISVWFLSALSMDVCNAMDFLGQSSAKQKRDSDLQLARRALEELGASVVNSKNRCSDCHAVTSNQIQAWGDAAKTLDNCIAKSGADAARKVECLKIEGGKFHPTKLGLFAARPDNAEFEAIFKAAFPPEQATQIFAEFVKTTTMPRGGENLISMEDFDSLRIWVRKGMPHLQLLLPQQPGLPDCEDSRSQALNAHLVNMKTSGWAAKNAENMMSMAGCVSENPLDCFTSKDVTTGHDVYPNAIDKEFSKDWAAQSPGANFRILANDVPLHYWVRSSADGRFIGTADSIVDIGTRSQPSRRIKITGGELDPVFTPDSSAFSFLNMDERPVFCPYHMLLNPNVFSIDLGNSLCRAFGDMRSYLFLGSSIDGDYQTAVNGTVVNDKGISGIDMEPSASQNSWLGLRVMANGTFEKISAHTFTTPFLSDWSSSVSGKLVGARRGRKEQGGNKHVGYELGLLNVSNNGLETHLGLAGKVCMLGAKSTFSYDESMMVTHHHMISEEYRDFGFASQNDPEFIDMLDKKTGNIFLADLVTGKKYRITTMKAGQRAVFPHFRSDGWLYFVVQDTLLKTNYVVATDAALRIQSQR